MKRVQKKTFSDKQFISDENFFFNQCSTIVKERPQMIRTSFYFQLFEGYGPNSKSRKEYINHCFNSIIDNAIPDEFKIFFMLYKQMTPETNLLLKQCAEATKYKRVEIQNKHNMHDLLKIFSEPENYEMLKQESDFEEKASTVYEDFK